MGASQYTPPDQDELPPPMSPSQVDEAVRAHYAAPVEAAPTRSRSSIAGSVLIAIAILLAGAVISLTIHDSLRTPKPKPPVKPVPGPAPHYIQKSAVADFNKQEHTHGTQSGCTYIASKWQPGYVFVCFIYKASGSQLGEVTFTSTSAANAPGGVTWNEGFVHS